MPHLPMTADHAAWLDAECRRLLAFGLRHDDQGPGGGWLSDDGVVEPGRGRHTWIAARMAHVYALGDLLGVPGCRRPAEAPLAALRTGLRDAEHGGWFPSLDEAGAPGESGGKECYAHAFVVLGSATATVARIEGASDLLDEALEVFESRFWDEEAGM